jgi:hypothetical protein
VLPEIKTIADTVTAQGGIAAAVADGELTPSEATDLSGFISNYAKAIEITEIDERLRRLEAASTGIDISTSGWDSQSVSYSAFVPTPFGSYLFYNGNDYGRTGFGVAVLEKS